MSNFTKVCNGTKIEDALCWTADLDHRGILSLVTNIPLSIVAFLGNALIIAALRKVSCCHPPSKVLLCGLAFSDLCIGLITQPLHVTYKLCMCFSEHSNHCVHRLDASMFTSTLFVGASLLTLTKISVDRLLALMMGPRYRQVVTLRRVQFSIALSWLLSGGLAVKKIIFPFNVLCVTNTAMLLCLIISTCCYAKIFNRLRRQEMQAHSHFQQGQQKTGLEAMLNITQYKKKVSSAQCCCLFCYLPHLVTLLLLSTQVIMGNVGLHLL